MSTPVQGSVSQNPINQIEQTPASQGGASGVQDKKLSVFQKFLSRLSKGFSLSNVHGKRRTYSINSNKGTEESKSKNFKEGAKNFGNFLLGSIEKHIPTPPILSLAKKVIHLLEKVDTSKSFKENVSDAFKQLKTALGEFKQNVFKELGKKVQNHPHTSQIFVKVFKEKLLSSDNKEIFNALPPEAQKAFIEQNKDAFFSSYGVDKNTIQNPKNKANFNNLPMEAKKVFIEQNEGNIEFLSTFSNVYKDELLSPDNKEIFNALPVEAQKAFIEQNKGDIKFLSTFSNIYKDELAYDSFSGDPMPELLTAFKDAIVSNRDQIIKNPTVLASADKASVLEVASTLQQTNGTVKEEDKPLMKALLTAYATVDANIVETQLKLVDKNAMFTPNSNAQPILVRLLSANTNEVSLDDKNTLGGIQVIKDLARGAELELKLPSGKTIDISKGFSKMLEGKGDSEKALAIFNEMKKQVNEKDKSAFIDFMCNFATQGFVSVHMPNMSSNKIDISGGNYKFFVDYSKQDVNGNSFVEVGVHVNGRAKGRLAINDNSLNILGVVFPTTNAEIVFTYDKGSLLECNNKASNIEVKHFEQELNQVFVGDDLAAVDGLRKIKNENGLSGSVNIDEFDALMANPQILQENIQHLDKNPAALRKIPKETLQSYIQKALEEKNESLAKALTKALDYLDQDTFEKKLLEANGTKNSKKSTINSEPLFNFFQNDDSTITLTDINFEVLNDAIRQADVKFITKDGKKITIGGYKFNGQAQEALNDIKQQIKEKNLTKDEIKALADFIANGYVQTYLNFKNTPVGFYRWDGDGKVHVTAQMSDAGLDVHVKTQGKLDSKDRNQVIIQATANGNMAALEKTVNTDVIFHYKGSIGGAQGVVDHISVKRFEQKIGDITFL